MSAAMPHNLVWLLQGSVWGSGSAGTACALAALLLGNAAFWQVVSISHTAKVVSVQMSQHAVMLCTRSVLTQAACKVLLPLQHTAVVNSMCSDTAIIACLSWLN